MFLLIIKFLLKMKKLKLIFGLLMVFSFFATIALANSVDDQAIRKDKITELPPNG